MSVLLLDLLFLIVLNGVFLLFCLVALISALKKRYPWGWYMIGAVTQGFCVFGSFSMFQRDPQMLDQFLEALFSFIFVLVLFWLLLYRIEKKREDRSDAEENLGEAVAAFEEEPKKETMELEHIEEDGVNKSEEETVSSVDGIENRFCICCGYALIEGSNFCGYCGTKIKGVSNESTANVLRQGVVRKQNTSETKTGRKKPRKKCLKKIFVCAGVLVLVTVLCGGVYIAVSYHQITSAINNGDFFGAQKHLDNIPAGEKLFAEERNYIEASVLMEEGEYIEALHAFNNLERISVPETITETLKNKIYAEGRSAYRSTYFDEMRGDGDAYKKHLQKAKNNFFAVAGYKRSADYLLLINCKTEFNYITYVRNDLLELVGFEDAGGMVLNDEICVRRFFEGSWKSGVNTLKVKDGVAEFDMLGEKRVSKFCLDDGCYSVSGKTLFEFNIINKNAVSVYCYGDRNTYVLYRQ